MSGAIPDDAVDLPWQVTLDGAYLGAARERMTAQDLVERPYRAGFAVVEHLRTQERWARDDERWERRQAPQRRDTQGARGA